MVSGFTDIYDHRTPENLELQRQLKLVFGNDIPERLLKIDGLETAWNKMISLRNEWIKVNQYPFGFAGNARQESRDSLTYISNIISRKYFNHYRDIRDTLYQKESVEKISGVDFSAIKEFLLSPLHSLAKDSQDMDDAGGEWARKASPQPEIPPPITQIKKAQQLMQNINELRKDLGVEKTKPFISALPLSKEEQERFRGQRGFSPRAY
jgi:hypothetical protein